MPKNQLFKINPDIHIVNDLLSAFGLEDLEDTRYFTREYLKENETVDKVIEIKERLSEYYLPCKKKSLDNLSEKRIITILRQFIKSFGYKCIGTEQSVKGKKTMKYQLIVMEREELSPSFAKREYVLSFD
jgi:hypothetical protein